MFISFEVSPTLADRLLSNIINYDQISFMITSIEKLFKRFKRHWLDSYEYGPQACFKKVK